MSRISNEDAELFVRVWQESKSVAEVAERTGLAVSSVHSRAARYRKLGIPLRKMPHGAAVNVARLTAIARGEG